MAEGANATVIGILKSKFDQTIFQLEFQVYNSNLLRCGKNKNSRGVDCYIRSDISYVQKKRFPKCNRKHIL